MKILLQKLRELKEQEREIKEERLAVEEEIYSAIESQITNDKTLTIHADEFKLSVKPNYSVKVDQEAAKEYGQYFKHKYEMTYSQYNALTDSARTYVNEIVTISTLKPTFTVEIK